jgi:hypothetical protein
MAARELDDWYHWALCADPSTEFYSFPENKEEEKNAKSVCRACPVRLECLAYALCRDEDEGIWGGVNFKNAKTAIYAFVRPPISSGVEAVLAVLIENTSD